MNRMRIEWKPVASSYKVADFQMSSTAAPSLTKRNLMQVKQANDLRSSRKCDILMKLILNVSEAVWPKTNVMLILSYI